MVIRLTLPLPPSSNNLFVNARKGRKRSDDYKAWRDEAGWLAKLATRHPSPAGVSGPYALAITVPHTMKGDVSNRVKAVEDLLVSLRITPDDQHAHRVTVQRGDVPGRQCIVEIESIAS